MGAYSPAPVVTPEIYQMVMDQIIYPTVRGMKKDGIVFTGFLYAGLMISKDAAGKPTVKTLEFNCRFGDPETQPIMSRLKSDFSELIEAGIDGSLDKVIAEWDPRCALGVVLASKGYPAAPRKGDVISGVELQGDDTVTFHAGTKFNGKGELVTSGGRVLCVVGLGDDLHQARDKAYKALDKVHFDGMQYRKDIGHRALYYYFMRHPKLFSFIAALGLGACACAFAQTTSPLPGPFPADPTPKPFDYPEGLSTPQFTLEQNPASVIQFGDFPIVLGVTPLSVVTKAFGGSLHHLPDRTDYLCYSAPIQETPKPKKKAKKKPVEDEVPPPEVIGQNICSSSVSAERLPKLRLKLSPLKANSVLHCRKLFLMWLSDLSASVLI